MRERYSSPVQVFHFSIFYSEPVFIITSPPFAPLDLADLAKTRGGMALNLPGSNDIGISTRVGMYVHQPETQASGVSGECESCTQYID